MKTGPKPRPAYDRMMSRVERITESGCWIFMGAVDGSGYTHMVVGSRSDGSKRFVKGHRVSYEYHKGPIPKHLQIDHLCRVRTCVNPDHLEAVTPQVNVLRGNTVAAVSASRTHCPRGHTYCVTNTRITLQNKRECRECQRARKSARVYGIDGVLLGRMRLVLSESGGCSVSPVTVVVP